jgi:diacylglycerol O-acyltransferase
MHALSPTDEIFLVLERSTQPMHVAGLFVFEPAPNAGPDFARTVMARLLSFDRPNPPYSERVVLTPIGHRFVRDKHFDIANHVRHAALPSPGGDAELHAWVAEQHEFMLHRERPLWEVHLVEGLSGGRIALYAKVHHAVQDGVSALRCAMRGLAADPLCTDHPPFWAAVRANRTARADDGQQRAPLREVLGAWRRDIGHQLASVPTLAKEATRLVRDATSHLRSHEPADAQRTPFSGRITSARRFGSTGFPLERFERLGKALGGTVNDAVLAMCSGALRHYLEERGALPTTPLSAMVPVSLRHGKGEFGNRVATIVASLATHEGDLATRLGQVLASVREGKERFAPMTNEEIVGVTAITLTPSFFGFLTGLGESACAFQVVISNVPGPKEALYLDGARMSGLYPVSIVVDHVALNITFTSYAGNLNFGVIACRHAIPDMERFIQHFEQALAELEGYVAASPGKVQNSLTQGR